MLEWVLTPPSWIYGAAVARRQRRTGLRLPIPVISVGAASMGGSGKTPAARAIRARLSGMGLQAALLSRGYGGQARGPLRVDPLRHTAREGGDEPLLHAADGPAWIARDRAAGAKAALAAGAQALVLDDAHQNPALRKDLSFLLLDGAEGLGNGRLFPAGPLRESLAAALARADAVILTREGAAPACAGLPVLQARLEPLSPAPPGPLVAFAGIAFPERLLASLQAAGGDVRELVPFPDHHPYAASELNALHGLAERHDARLVTTEKDAARLPPAWRERVGVFRVALRFADETALDGLLRSALDAPR